MTMPTLLKVEPREGYRIWVEYDDGASGEVDLSDVAGMGVFKAWEDRAFFEGVYVTDFDAIGWSDELDICPDRVYFDLTGKTPEEMMPGLRALAVDTASACLDSESSI